MHLRSGNVQDSSSFFECVLGIVKLPTLIKADLKFVLLMLNCFNGVFNFCLYIRQNTFFSQLKTFSFEESRSKVLTCEILIADAKLF